MTVADAEERIAARAADLVVARLIDALRVARPAEAAVAENCAAEPPDLVREVLDNLRGTPDEWRTSREVATKCLGGVKVNRRDVERALAALVATGSVLRRKGAPGRHPTAICFQAVVSAGLEAETTGSAVEPGGDEVERAS